MKKVFLLIILTTILINAKSQIFGKMIEGVIQSTVLINDSIGSASGIIVRDSSRIFLVTAKHVIFNPNKNYSVLNSNNIEIVFYAKNFKNDKKNYILVELNSAIKAGLLLVDKQLDICVVYIADIDKKGLINYKDGVYRNNGTRYDQYYISKETITTKDSVHLGENVFTVGFPGSIGLKNIPQFDYEMPLLKRGAVAGASKKYNTIIVDCPVYHGNSGGPVFLERFDYAEYSISLIGIVVEFIPLINPTISQKDLTIETSSYGVIVPIEYALNLITKIK